MKIQFYLARPLVKNDKGKAIANPSDTGVVAHIHLSGKLMRVGTGISAAPKYWNHNTHRAKNTPAYRQGSSINALLDQIKGEIESCYYIYKKANGAEPSQATFKGLIDVALGRRKEVKLTFLEYFQDFIDRTKAGQRQTSHGKIIDPIRAKYYGTTLNKLNDFQKTWAKKLDFDTIDLEFYRDFTGWLRRKGFAENNVGEHVKNIKTVLNEATERGFNQNLAFRSKRFMVVSEEVENIALSEKELTELQELDLRDTPYLDRTRDLFLVGCYTGLRYSDFSRLTTEHIKGDFIEIKQQKTGKPVAIPLHNVVREIIKKYDGDLPPAISNQKTNAYLKEVCQKVESLCQYTSKTTTKGGVKVTKRYHKFDIISSHTARRTFATNAYLQGIPSITIMAVTGHRTERNFLKYIKVTPREHAKIMAAHWAKKKTMTGKELFKKYTAAKNEYSKLLFTLYVNIMDDLFPLLERAEKEGKRLGLTPEPKGYLRDEYTVEDIIFVDLDGMEKKTGKAAPLKISV